MLEKVKDTIEKWGLIEKADKIVVGVSGGPDSICLLHVLQELGYEVCVAHIHHGLRENANLDEKFVKEFCEARGIPFFVKHVNLKELADKMTIEEAGRKVRYAFFNEILQKEKCQKIATAHNCNDRVETVLMNLIRGSGLSGLKGIEIKRENIIRPLLACTREEIETYCMQNHLNPRKDESNEETIYTRNKVRLELIPYIESHINSNVVQTINRMADIVTEEERFLWEETEKAYQACIQQEEPDKIICDLKKFNAKDPVLKRRLIIKIIIKILGNAKDIERIHIEDILKLCHNNVGDKFLMPNKNIKVYVNKGKVEFVKMYSNSK